MTWFKHIAMLVLCLSIVGAGFPVQAKLQCPMAMKMHMQQMDVKAMKGCCDKMAKQDQQGHQKKNGCCGDMACAAHCSSMSNIVPMLSGNQFAALSSSTSTVHFYAGDRLIASHLLNTQDRPPKSLS
ncbi:MAG: hypothetical protein KGI29_10195 [Pseudomonadota bacterium]|nr:hypothetical protein [Pseudomonadota bacterium]